ncbi:MAG: AAA family ATPase [Gammaproteobacteria bacterium]|nr:AAA family ATPase [Gammaproteobacteria bacterium]MBV8405770.1 AAA family ATPase [Gammaproteobacteria bacterium]
MYLSFFGLNEKPFAITPDPRYLYLSERHAEALAHLLYGINEAGGFVQLTGEVGTGKTTIVRSLLAQTPKNAEIALILNPKMTAPEFLLTICEELGIGVPDSALGSLKDLVDILSEYLLRAHAAGHRVVLVVDEAQNLWPEVLEQVRLLTNLETNTQKLLQIILIGQPELRELLARNELRQLAQRITGRYHLNPLSHEETAAYVLHRLRVAGATTDIFAPQALNAVFRLSQGVPRVINVICDRALLGAYSLDRHRVTAPLVRSAAAEVFGRRYAPDWLPWAATAAIAFLLSGVTFAMWKTQPWRAHPSPAVETAAPAAHAESDAALPVALASAPHAEARAPQLQQLLAQHLAETDTDSAFGKLFGLWGAKYQPSSTDPCTQAASAGLACIAERGSFGQLRLYNHPAILLLHDAAGATHQVVLTALDDEQARLDLGGGQTVGLGELSHYWLGDFVMLWRPASSPVKALSSGMRGEQVRWLRRSLQRVRGAQSDGPVSDVFDDELTGQVREFQRLHQLAVDGIAGVQTQIALAGAIAGSDAPLLSAVDTHHGG